jgi:16S rRNA (cytosine1402-N4)-methyltransferase
MNEQENHVAVLLEEAVSALHVEPGNWYIDGTFGRGGHTAAILQKGGKVIAFDVDAEAIQFGQEKFAQEIEQGNLILVRENFDKLNQVVERLRAEKKVDAITGVLFDFGTSTNQLKNAERGFSFAGDGDLDMRMDDRLGVKAKDLLAVLSEKQLSDIFFLYGGEHEAKKIAKAIVEERKRKPLQTVFELRTLIERKKREKRGHLNPATKIFQALRIAVNDELTSIEQVLSQALAQVKSGGNIVTIGFHEGEDRLAKYAFKEWEKQNMGKMVNKDVILPSEGELLKNTRARSAKMRIFEKS